MHRKKFHMHESAALQVVVKSFQTQESLAYEKEKEDLVQADSLPHRAERNGISVLSVGTITNRSIQTI